MFSIISRNWRLFFIVFYLENKRYIDLKEEDEIRVFNLYIEDILEFDPNFNTIFKILQKSVKFFASRNNFINNIKLSPYYILSIIKFIIKTIILIIYFYYTIKDDTYVCSYNLAFNYTMTNESFFPIKNNTISNINSFCNDLCSNHSYWSCELGKCKVVKVIILNEIKIYILFYLKYLLFFMVCTF